MASGSVPCANFWPYHTDRTSRSSVESFCGVIVERVVRGRMEKEGIGQGKREQGNKGGKE